MSDAVRRHTPTLDGLLAWARGIGGTWRVEVQAPDEQTAKLAYLAAGGRDFLEVTPTLRKAVVDAVAADAARTLTGAGNLRTEATLRAAGAAIKAVVLGRFEGRLAGARLRALRAATVRAKARAADPTVRANAARIGRAHDDLYAALKAATFTLRRTGGGA